MKIDPACQMGWKQLAEVHFFSRDCIAFRETAERAMALNPRDGITSAFMAILIAYSGDWERGAALAQRTMELNRHHPGWYHLTVVHHQYRKGDYEAALQTAKKINLPEFHWAQLMIAAACGMLGRREEAHPAIELLRKYNAPFLDLNNVRDDIEKWLTDKDDVEQLLVGLQKVGLKFGPAGSAAREAAIVPKSEGSRAPAAGSDSASGQELRTGSGQVRADEGFWVAVLPFKYRGQDSSLESLAEGIAEEIITGLSRFSYLRVIARGSTAKYSSESGDVRILGKDLGARYVMEGSLRQAGTRLRLAVQLVDTSSGAHLWAENYERTFSPETTFELQDDLVSRIVSTVADMNGVLPRSMSQAVRSRPPEQLSPYEAVLRSFAYFEIYTPEELTASRSGLEAAVRKAPAYADAWAMLSCLCAQDYVHGYELQANALETAASAARRAVELAPSNHLAYFSLAQALSYQKDYDSFREAVERAVALNPMDGNSLALLGELLTYAGNPERGMQLAGQAKRLNPNHPGGYWYADFYQAFSQGDYRAALGFALKTKLHGNPLAPMFIAAACGQLGDREGGAKAVNELMKFRPELPGLMRKQVAKVWNPEYGARFLDGLRKAGMAIPETETSVAGAGMVPSTVKVESGAARVAEGFWVAVLPFKYSDSNPDLKGLSEGLSEEVITGLSRFSYLRVIARGSTAKYTSESGDVRAIGKELGARYVMEGSLRQAGNRVRLAVQLVDTASGAHLWAETFDRPFQPEALFDLQDELVPRIVSTVADHDGILPLSMAEALRNKSEDALTPYEAVLRAFSYFTRITPEEHAAVRNILERAVREAPDHADSWAMLSMMYRGEFAQGFNAGSNPLDRALAAAQRAVDLAPTHALGHYALATVYFFRKEMIPFRVSAERALALNPLDGSVRAYLGLLTACAGEWDRGCQMVESAMQLNPNYPGWFQFAVSANAYRQGKYEEAVEALVRSNMRGYFHMHAALAASLGQLGRREDARKAIQDLLALRPDFAAAARQEYAKWYSSEDIEHLIDGLRKAGLEVPAPAPPLAKV